MPSVILAEEAGNITAAGNAALKRIGSNNNNISNISSICWHSKLEARQQAAGPGGLDPMEDQQDCQIWYSWGWGGKAIEQEWQGSQQEEDIWKSLQP